MLEKILNVGRKIIPKKIFKFFQPAYHFTLAFLASLVYRFPSRKIFVLLVTGTKGKTSTIEITNAILEEAGYKTALASTLRFKIGERSIPNKMKMTSPGRFFFQSFLRQAVIENCDYAILEMTSESAKQFRHKFINFDALIFTNLSPEHIEAHGSYENYKQAKLSLAKALECSSKKKRFVIINQDDEMASDFLKINVEEKIPYSVKNLDKLTLKKEGLIINTDGKMINSKLSGEFNAYNILASYSFAKSQGIKIEIIKKAIEKFPGIPGRMEKIDEGQSFSVIVDYAHTSLSLEQVYKSLGNTKKICVLGSAGGGRDKWKRPQIGKIASKYCNKIILTDEDPYDEDPMQIIKEVAGGIENSKYKIIIDRREAISEALKQAKKDSVVIITGKGTDPYIMGKNGYKVPWSDASITREELRKISTSKIRRLKK